MLSGVCLSVTRVYCDKTAEVRIIQFLLKCSPMLYFLPAKFDDQILRGSTRSWARTGVGWFSIDFAILYLKNDARYNLGDNH